MINLDIRFLKHLLLIISELLSIIYGKYKDEPGERHYVIGIANKTKKQLEYIIHEAEDEEAREYIRGAVKEADF